MAAARSMSGLPPWTRDVPDAEKQRLTKAIVSALPGGNTKDNVAAATSTMRYLVESVLQVMTPDRIFRVRWTSVPSAQAEISDTGAVVEARVVVDLRGLLQGLLKHNYAWPEPSDLKQFSGNALGDLYDVALNLVLMNLNYWIDWRNLASQVPPAQRPAFEEVVEKMDDVLEQHVGRQKVGPRGEVLIRARMRLREPADRPRSAAARALPQLAALAGRDAQEVLPRVESFATDVWLGEKTLRLAMGIDVPREFDVDEDLLRMRWSPTLDLVEVVTRALVVDAKKAASLLRADPRSLKEIAGAVGRSAGRWASDLDSWRTWLGVLLYVPSVSASEIQEELARSLGLGELMGHSRQWLFTPVQLVRSSYVSGKLDGSRLDLDFEVALKMKPVSNIAKHLRTAMVHDTPEALEKYLKEHPKADKSRHKVKPGAKELDQAEDFHKSKNAPPQLAKYLKRMPVDFLDKMKRDPSQKELVNELLRQPDVTVEKLEKLHADAHEYYLGQGNFRGITKEGSPEAMAQAQAQALWRATADAMRALFEKEKKKRGDRLVAKLVAKVFPSEEAKREYLKEHPRADPANHEVAKPGDERRDRFKDLEKGTSHTRIHQMLAPKALNNLYDPRLPSVTPQNKDTILRKNPALAKVVQTASSMSPGDLRKAREDSQEYMQKLIDRRRDIKNVGGDPDADLDRAISQAHAVWYAISDVEKKGQGGSSMKKRALDKLARMVRSRYEEGKPADPTEQMSEEDAAEWEENTEKYGDKFKTAKIQLKTMPGTRVIVNANPASRMLYRGGMLPPDGSRGTISTVPLPGVGKRSYLAGPGGGLVYVSFDNGLFMGVSPIDLNKLVGPGSEKPSQIDMSQAQRVASRVLQDRETVRSFRRRFSKFEEGKPADPTEHMSEEDAAEWEENTEKYGDKFKTASFEEFAQAAVAADSDHEEEMLILDGFVDLLKYLPAKFRSMQDSVSAAKAAFARSSNPGDKALAKIIERCEAAVTEVMHSGDKLGRALANPAHRFGASTEGRYEEGKPADPTEQMDEEDAAKWEENIEKYGDKFKD